MRRAARAQQKSVATLSVKRSTKWLVSGSHKTKETGISLEERLALFPKQSLCVASSPNGKVLFCKCCPKTIQNILGTLRTHVNSEKHKERLKLWQARGRTDEHITQFLHEYFMEHEEEKTSSVSKELQLHRWRVVEACMYAGVPLDKIDALRTLLERSGVALSGSQHFRQFLPKIESYEYQRIVGEVKGESVCLIYDGTTRLGECSAVLLRWCSSSFEIKQRLIALRTVKKHMSAVDSLGPFLIDILGQVGVRSSSVVCMARDSCSTNGKAERNIKPILTESETMMCIAHTLSHCAEHVDTPTLKEFSTPWLSLVQHHPSAKAMWRECVGGAMKGFSNIRWFSREEVCNELAENFSQLPNYIDALLEDGIGDAHPKSMKEILVKQGDVLQVCTPETLAC